MFQFELRGIRRAIKDLRTFARRALPYAIRNSLNAAAFETRREWSSAIEREFITRNKFTARTALQVAKATGTNPGRMFALVGSIAPYQRKQEFGGTTRGPIPGPVAAGQKPGSVRTKPVRLSNRLRALRAATPGKGHRKQRNAIAIAIAKRKGLKHVVLDRPRGGKGLFRLAGGKRATHTRLVWSLRTGPKRVDPTPTLGPTIKRLERRYLELHLQEITKQLRRHRVLGY